MILIQYFEAYFQCPFSFAFAICCMKSSNDIKVVSNLHAAARCFQSETPDGIAVV
jgi:hypothetical protein